LTTPFVHDFDLAIGRVFGLPVYWYGAVYTLGFLGVFAWFALRRKRLGWSTADVLELSCLMALGILIGGRVFDILVYELDYYRANPLQAANWWVGGMASHGVMLGGTIGVFAFAWLRGKPLLVAADELTVPAAFLMGIGRIGNFIEGGVIGSVTTMPWGVVFPGVDGPRHPVALYDGAKNLLLVPILILVLRRWPAGRGVATGAFLFPLWRAALPRRPLARLRGRLAWHRPGPVLQPRDGGDRPRRARLVAPPPTTAAAACGRLGAAGEPAARRGLRSPLPLSARHPDELDPAEHRDDPGRGTARTAPRRSVRCDPDGYAVSFASTCSETSKFE
jgi:prolipoprotein diacylglyceryl transferase